MSDPKISSQQDEKLKVVDLSFSENGHTDAQILDWVVDRFVIIYKESSNVDFLHRIRRISERLKAGYPTK